MSNASPPVDSRTAAALRAEVTSSLRKSVGEWAATSRDEASIALIAVLVRFAEIVIDRLNRAPEKNLLAFLDLLGAARLPPVAARAPLTFTLTPGGTADAVVPAGTQVAAASAEGDAASVVFETERELTVVAASLQALVAVDAERDMIADCGALLAGPVPDGLSVFSGDQVNEHVLYLGHASHLAHTRIDTLTLTFEVSDVAPAASDQRVLQWDLWDGENGVLLNASDGTQTLSESGTINFTGLPQVPVHTVNGVRSRWLRCRLLTPISPQERLAQGMVRAAQLPLIAGIGLSVQHSGVGLAPDVAFANAQSVDVSRAFQPFGERPRVGDAFHIGHREAFGQPGAAITLDIALVNPAPAGPPPFAGLSLRWEAWTGAVWVSLGVTTTSGSIGGSSLVDGSKAFTKSGAVTFILPASLAPMTVNGVESHWIRVQIIAGNYGVDATLQPDASQPGGFRLVPSTLAPPLVSAIALSYGAVTSVAAPEAVLAFSNGQFQDLSSSLKARNAAPFACFPAQPTALYAAFALPPTRKKFPNRTITLYHGVRAQMYGETATPLFPQLSVQSATGVQAMHSFRLTNSGGASLHCELQALGSTWPSTVAPAAMTVPPGASTEIKVFVEVPAAEFLSGANAGDRGFLQLRASTDTSTDARIHTVTFETRVDTLAPRRRELRFEYWNGNGWAKLSVVDGTDRLAHAGVVEFLGPDDFASSRQFGVSGYWLRALLEGSEDAPVRLRTLALNTTFAGQTVTLRNEVLGSSDATANQQFRTTRSPVLAEAQLEVREPESPSADEVTALTARGDASSKTAVSGSSQAWVPWVEMTDFHGSTPQDRHYVLDHISGQLKFGDGVHGRIPPRGVGNIRMKRYQSGGGAAGNRPPDTLVQLKTTVPYIDAVTNLEAASGGADAESDAAVLARAPRMLRHGGRAVALADFEDLARMATPEVARVKAAPLRQLLADPLGNAAIPGAVSVIIVPLSAETKPTPSTRLMGLVENHLRKFMTPAVSLAVVGPLYVRIDVSVEVALSSLNDPGAVEGAVRAALDVYLHPLTGGREGAGWDFGREPELSDLHAILLAAPGVDHLRRLSIDPVEEPPGAMATNRFLVYSGQHRITLTFAGDE